MATLIVPQARPKQTASVTNSPVSVVESNGICQVCADKGAMAQLNRVSMCTKCFSKQLARYLKPRKI